MKIALFSDSYAPEANGVAMSVRMLHEGLVARGHDVWVFAPQNPIAQKSEKQVVRIPSLPIFILPENRMATPLDPRIMKIVREQKFDIIHVHTEFGVGGFGFRAHEYYDIPLIYTSHTVWEEYTHYIAFEPVDPAAKYVVRLAIKEVADRADRVVAPTKKTADLLRSYKVISPIDIIPTGVDLSRFSPANEEDALRIEQIKERWGLKKFERILVTIGRVAPEKSVKELLLMTEPYLVANPDTAFVIVGDGSAMKDLRKIAEKSAAQDQIVFTGTIPWEEVPDYYRLADVFIGNSHTETQGLTFIEALACGAPIVCRHNECFEGIIEDGVSGSLFRREEDFLPALEQLLGDEDLYATRVKAGLTAAKNISVDRFVDQIIRSYEDALETRKLLGERPMTLVRAITKYSDVVKSKMYPTDSES